MVYIIVTSWFPANKAKEVGKKVIEAASKYPPDRTLTKTVLQGGMRATKDGLKLYVINEVKEGKYKEAIAHISKTMLFYAEIEGFKYEIETLMSAVEAMPLIGLKMPEE
jgi:hypothetical protein